MVTLLHIRSTTGLYGAERALLALASETKAPYRPAVAVLARDPATPLLRAAQEQGLALRHFRSEGRLDTRCAALLAVYAEEVGAGILHAHDFKSLFLALQVGQRVGVPVVATFHGDTGACLTFSRYQLTLSLYESVGRVLANACAAVAVVSRSLERTLRFWAPATRIVF